MRSLSLLLFSFTTVGKARVLADEIHPLVSSIVEEKNGNVEFCVVGAGPAGVQLAHHFQSVGADYIVLERGSAPGSFYATFPRHDQLSTYYRFNHCTFHIALFHC